MELAPGKTKLAKAFFIAIALCVPLSAFALRGEIEGFSTALSAASFTADGKPSLSGLAKGFGKIRRVSERDSKALLAESGIRKDVLERNGVPKIWTVEGSLGGAGAKYFRSADLVVIGNPNGSDGGSSLLPGDGTEQDRHTSLANLAHEYVHRSIEKDPEMRGRLFSKLRDEFFKTGELAVPLVARGAGQWDREDAAEAFSEAGGDRGFGAELAGFGKDVIDADLYGGEYDPENFPDFVGFLRNGASDDWLDGGTGSRGLWEELFAYCAQTNYYSSGGELRTFACRTTADELFEKKPSE